MKQLLLFAALIGATTAASAYEADLDGVTFNIDTVYHQVVGPGVTRTKLTLSAPSRSFSVYTSVLDRNAGATVGEVEPRVIIGNDKCQIGETVSSMASRHTGGDIQYLTGINGDFFITSAFASQHEFGSALLGYPNMACVIDGKIAAPDMIDVTSRENALVVASDNWYIDATDFKYRLLNNDGSTIVDATAVNYPRRDNEMMVYNSYMGASTATSDNGRELVLRMAEGADWHINKTTKFIVQGSWIAGGNTAIPEDGIVISCGPSYSNEWIDGLSDGDVVKLKIVVALPAHDNVKPDIQHIIGGDVRILNQGEITREAIRWINTPSSPYQRSLVGFNQDRTMMMFAAVDGTGLNYYECAALMRTLGCYDALDLDGGGSTAIWSDAFGIYNSPRDGAERAIGNALFFTVKAPVDKVVTSIRFADYVVRLPKYGSYTPVIFGYNQYGQLVDTDVQGFTLSAPAELGEADGSTLVASGSGVHALTAQLGEMSTSVAVYIDDSYPTTAKYSTLLVDNYHPARIALYSQVNGEDMEVSAAAFDWISSDEAVATVDADGIISGIADGTATITGTCGDIAIPIEVTVQCPKAASVPLSPDDDATAWSCSGTNVTVNSLLLAEQPAFAIDFQVKSARAKLNMRRDILLYSLPDALRLVINTGDLQVSNLTLSITPNGGKALTSAVENLTPNADNEVLFEFKDFIDTTDPGIYPLTFKSFAFTPSSGAGAYNITINTADILYYSYTDGVDNICTDARTLRPAISGKQITLPEKADNIVLLDLQGRIVASARNAASITAPATGFYILHVTKGDQGLSTKIIIK